jgi:excisionase family DNA binding protein
MTLTLSLNEVAAYLGVSTDTVSRLLEAGHLKRVPHVRSVRILLPGVAERLDLSLNEFVDLQRSEREAKATHAKAPFGRAPLCGGRASQ